MWFSIECVLLGYVAIGLVLVAVGPVGKEIKRIADAVSDFDNKNRKDLSKAQIVARHWLTRVVLGALGCLIYPIILHSRRYPKYQLVTSPQLLKDQEERKMGLLRFAWMYNRGCIDCQTCGITTAVIWNQDSLLAETELGYQCQQCGRFHALKVSAPVRPCECAGVLSRDELVFCPHCRSTLVKGVDVSPPFVCGFSPDQTSTTR